LTPIHPPLWSSSPILHSPPPSLPRACLSPRRFRPTRHYRPAAVDSTLPPVSPTPAMSGSPGTRSTRRLRWTWVTTWRPGTGAASRRSSSTRRTCRWRRQLTCWAHGRGGEAAPVRHQLSLQVRAGEEVAKRHLYVISSLFKYALGKTVIRPHMEHMGALFEQLSLWVPELFVHQQDMICTGFIDYFVQRQQLQKRFPGMARTAATLAFRVLLHLSSVSGVRHKERRQLLPSARLWVNSSEVGCLRAHELQQWCQPKLMLRSNLYN
jgi:hypothetical protein